MMILTNEELEDLEDATIAKCQQRNKKIDKPKMKVDGASVKLLFRLGIERARRQIDRSKRDI